MPKVQYPLSIYLRHENTHSICLSSVDYINFVFASFCVSYSTGEILYRVELPYMEEITLIYLENSDNYDDYSKC